MTTLRSSRSERIWSGNQRAGLPSGTVLASSNETPCLARLSRAFSGSQVYLDIEGR